MEISKQVFLIMGIFIFFQFIVSLIIEHSLMGWFSLIFIFLYIAIIFSVPEEDEVKE